MTLVAFTSSPIDSAGCGVPCDKRTREEPGVFTAGSISPSWGFPVICHAIRRVIWKSIFVIIVTFYYCNCNAQEILYREIREEEGLLIPSAYTFLFYDLQNRQIVSRYVPYLDNK